MEGLITKDVVQGAVAQRLIVMVRIDTIIVAGQANSTVRCPSWTEAASANPGGVGACANAGV